MLRLTIIVLLLSTHFCYSQKLLQEGKAYTYSYRVKGTSSTFVATTLPGLTISDLRHLTIEELNSLMEEDKKHAPHFFIRVYTDHIVATRPDKPDFKETIPRKNLVGIAWVK